MMTTTTTKHTITTIALLLLIVLLCEGSPELSQVSRSISTRDLSGTFSRKAGEPCFTASIKWSAVQNKGAMMSTVTAEFYLEKTSTYNVNIKNFNSDRYTITIDGQEKTSGGASFNFPHNSAVGTKQTIGTATNNVKHNADGTTKSVNISATLSSGSSLGTLTVSGTAELDPIAVVVKVTFNGNGGAPPEITRSVTYGKTYGALPGVTRTGYIFLGWFTSDGTEIKSDSIVNIANTEHILYAHWSINSYTISFNTNSGSSCSPITQDYNTTITLPSTTKAGHTFDYWCSDPALTSRYTASTMPPENIVLYAKYAINNYTVTFLSDGSVVKSEQLNYQSNITHPDNLTKAGYSLAGWNSSTTSVPDHNVAIEALWEANVYVIEFDPNGGDALANKTMCVTYDDVYGELPEATRTGHTFLGWFTNATGGYEVTSNSTVNTASNHTLYAQWSIIIYSLSSDLSIEVYESSSNKNNKDENATNIVEVVFGAKDLSKDEIVDIIKRYAGAEFTVVNYKGGNEAGDTMVIIKFTNTENAQNFVDAIKASSEVMEDKVKSVRYIQEPPNSLSQLCCPNMLFAIFWFVL